jgi:hypothetical protein
MSNKPRFKEVIRPPFWLIAFLYFMLFSLVLAMWAALGNTAAINAFAISIVLGLVAIYLGTSTIIVDQDELRIKRAHIPIKYLGVSEVIGKKDFSFARTRGADPAAYFATTFWISQGVKIEVNDERDPTPYWLISTKRAKDLIAAIKASEQK